MALSSRSARSGGAAWFPVAVVAQECPQNVDQVAGACDRCSCVPLVTSCVR